MVTLGRRAVLLGTAGLTAAIRQGWAADKMLTIGMSVPLTGELAR